DGKRAVFGARGDVFTVPAKTGVTRNLTHSSGAHDRNVGWSPDGHWISFISDRTGADELYIQQQDGTSPAKQLTEGGGAYKFRSDGKRAVFGARGDVFTVPAKTGVTRNLTHSSGAHDRNVGWSPDGHWISFISDRTGADELYIQQQDGTSPAKQLTEGGGAYKF